MGSITSLITRYFDIDLKETMRHRWLWVAALTTLLLFGCGSPPQPTLHIGTNLWQGYGPLYLADEKGFYGKGPIRLVEYSSTTQVLQAFRNRAIEAAAVTLGEALTLAQDVPDVSIVLVMDISDGADALLARPGVDSLAALRDKRVGVEATGLGAHMTAHILQRAGLIQADITLVPLWLNAHERAYDEGDIDALITFEPIRSRLLAKGARELFNSSQIPDHILDVLVLRRSTVEGNPDQIQTLLNGWFLATDFIHKNPSEASQFLSPRLGITPDEVIKNFKEIKLAGHEDNHTMLTGHQPQLLDIANKLQTILVGNHLLREPLDIRSLINPGPHDKMH